MQRNGVVFQPERLGDYIDYVGIEYYGKLEEAKLSVDKEQQLKSDNDITLKWNKVVIAYYVTKRNVIVVGVASLHQTF